MNKSEGLLKLALSKIFYKDGKLFRYGKEMPCSLDRQGYRMLNINNKMFKEHRIIWYMHHDHTWPLGEIDHINENKQDNRIENLRDVPKSVNLHNITSANKSSTSGVRGVTACGNKFMAKINLAGKQTYLGLYDTIVEARQAYIEAKEKYLNGLKKSD